MFTLPEVPNTPQEGSSEESPLFLEGIKADELKEFLRVLCSRFATGNNPSIRSIASSWLPVLKLASLWQFPGLREKALKYLKCEDCMTRLHVARQYGIEDWFLPALKGLISRDEPLTADEINQLGVDFAAKVIALREQVRGPPIPASIDGTVIRRMFEGNSGASA